MVDDNFYTCDKLRRIPCGTVYLIGDNNQIHLKGVAYQQFDKMSETLFYNCELKFWNWQTSYAATKNELANKVQSYNLVKSWQIWIRAYYNQEYVLYFPSVNLSNGEIKLEDIEKRDLDYKIVVDCYFPPNSLILSYKNSTVLI